MKHTFLLFILAAASISVNWSPAILDSNKSITLTIDYKFTNIEEGYDHPNKIVVFIDEEEAGTSKEQLQSKPGSFSTKVTKGKHDIKVIFMAKYEGTWEEHTIANNYSYDCIVETTANFNKSKKMSIKVDLDEGITYKLN